MYIIPLQCPNNTLDNGSSCMVVFGGFPSNSTLSMPSRESWLYNGHNESWTRLADAVSGYSVPWQCVVLHSLEMHLHHESCLYLVKIIKVGKKTDVSPATINTSLLQLITLTILVCQLSSQHSE